METPRLPRTPNPKSEGVATPKATGLTPIGVDLPCNSRNEELKCVHRFDIKP